jgi:hypothetical protein
MSLKNFAFIDYGNFAVYDRIIEAMLSRLFYDYDKDCVKSCFTVSIEWNPFFSLHFKITALEQSFLFTGGNLCKYINHWFILRNIRNILQKNTKHFYRPREENCYESMEFVVDCPINLTNNSSFDSKNEKISYVLFIFTHEKRRNNDETIYSTKYLLSTWNTFYSMITSFSFMKL